MAGFSIIANKLMLHPKIAERLTPDDDSDLWEVALSLFFVEAQRLAADKRQDVYIQVGCCHHWISPHHPIHWLPKGRGRFAWPFGYDKTTTLGYHALPKLTWSVFLRWTGDNWEVGRTGKKCLTFRIAIPARTARHLQAAIHTIWTPHSPTTREKITQLFGFRKINGKWLLTAREKSAGGLGRRTGRARTRQIAWQRAPS
jgi:hypothetical protein